MSAGSQHLPRLVADAGEKTARRFVEFVAATIRNKNTRIAYAHAVEEFFDWCGKRRLTLTAIDSVVVAADIGSLTAEHSAPTVKQHLSSAAASCPA